MAVQPCMGESQLKKKGCKMKLGCQNLMYNLLNWNVHNTYNLCSEQHGEHSEQHLFNTKFQRIKEWGGGGGGERWGY